LNILDYVPCTIAIQQPAPGGQELSSWSNPGAQLFLG